MATENKDEDQKKKNQKNQSFEDLGLDARLVRALYKEGITKPTRVQSDGIPRILEGKDVIAHANTGSGKTYTYVLPMLQKLFSETTSGRTAPSAIILVPSRELCQQVCKVVQSVLDYCRVQLKVVKLLSDMRIENMKTELSWHPEIVVSTPACISTCLSRGVIQPTSLMNSLSMLVLDEADLLLSFGYENDLKALVPQVPHRCQCLLMTASPSDSSTGADIEKLRNLLLHDPEILTSAEEGNDKEDVIPKSIGQFWVSCNACDKMLHILALLKLEVIHKKVLIFVNSIEMAYRLKLFLEQFGLKSAVLNAELPQNSRLHILEEFNAGLFDYLIATDDSKAKDEQTTGANQVQSKSKKHPRQKNDSEFSAVRGIDFKNVFTVINYNMPQNFAGYVHRVGRTGRAQNTGTAISLACPEEAQVFENIKLLVGHDEHGSSNSIAPYTFLTKEAVEALRYRAEDVAKGVTKLAVRESRAQDLRNEILNSKKLKAHFEDNPRDLELLKHDKVLSKKPPPPHLRQIPEYLIDPKTQEASKVIQLSQAAMTAKSSTLKKRFRGRFSKSKDPLKTLWVEKKRSHKGGMKRKNGFANAGGSKNSKKAKT